MNVRTGAITVIGLLLGFLTAGILLISAVPDIQMVQSVKIEPSSGDVILGWPELGQRFDPYQSADDEHLRIRRSEKGWEMANVSSRRRVDVQTTRYNTLFLKRWFMQPGDVLSLGKIHVEVVRAGPEGLILKSLSDGRTVEWRGRELHFPPSEPVESKKFFDGMKRCAGHVFTSLFRNDADAEMRLFSLGGGVNGVQAWAFPDSDGFPIIPVETAVVYRRGDRYFLGPGRSGIPIHMDRPNSPLLRSKRFNQLFMPLDGPEGRVQKIILGKTRYRVDFNDACIRFIPESGADAWMDGEKKPSSRTVSMSEPPVPLWQAAMGDPSAMLKRSLPFIILMTVLTILISGLLFFSRKRISRFFQEAPQDALLVWIPLCAGIPLTLILWQIRVDVDFPRILLMTWAAWAYAAAVLIRKDRLRGLDGVLWCCAFFLAGFGTLTLAQLSLGADNTRWLDFGRKHALVLALSAWSLPLFYAIPAEALRDTWTQFCIGQAPGWRWLRQGLAGLGMGILLLQGFFGGERGLWDIQPAEMGKLLIVFVAAFTGMNLNELRLMNAKQFKDHPLPLLWGFLRVLFFSGLLVITVLAGVRDISPVLILSVFLLAWIWAVAPHPTEESKKGILFRGGVVVFLLVSAFAVWWAYTHPRQLPNFLPQRDRFLVWAQPEEYPYAGEQVGKSMRLAGSGGWTGVSTAFAPNGNIMTLPMVQNDFIGSFVLYKFGGFAGMILVLVQIIYVGALFEAGRAARQWGKTARHSEPRRAGDILSLILFGLAWMHTAQWAIAWGNTLGLLPVMGQPMTWISSANSHIAFFALPTLITADLVGRIR
jgi:cell division protein FtsW (lipid II flippase)